MAETALQKYGEVDPAAAQAAYDKWKKEAAERKTRNYMKIEVGSNLLRVMPPWKMGVPIPFKEVWLHRIRGESADDMGVPVVCPAKQHNMKCTILCARVKELRATGDKADKEAAYELSAQPRYFANAVNLAKPEDGVRLWEFGTKLFDQLMNLLTNPVSGCNYTHPQTGRILVVDRVGTGKTDTKYTASLALVPSPLANLQWLEHMTDLDALAETMDDKRIQDILSGKATAEPADPSKPEYIPPGAKR